MLGGGFKAERLRVNLRLVMNRLKLLEKKKTELTQKARKEIADYLSTGKDERARIRVEHIIREDYLVEAMEILELYCDLLLARFGLVQSMKELEPGLQEAVSTLIWAAPRMQSEVVELKIVADQLCAKYSKEYGKLCRSNQIGTVNDRTKGGPGGRGGGGGGGGGDFTVPAGAVPMPMPMPSPHVPFNYPQPKGPANFSGPEVGTYESFNNFQPPVPGMQPPQLPSCAPTYEFIDDLTNNTAVPSPKATGPSLTYDNTVLPELPSVPDTLPASSFGGNSAPSEDIDFDDLSRRFEDLKKKT
ncbi:IST1-like [Acipenser ruthenus]|uniref:IST1 homolog n=1 Tax=Acipenser ruthenus TaxID=7906 RepID=A0A444TWD8_ACIRT|nr:IST1-like [Acipenser ruthenus]